jgi:hypothetical protein
LDYINPLFLFSYPFDKRVNIHANREYKAKVELTNVEEFIHDLNLINLNFDLFLWFASAFDSNKLDYITYVYSFINNLKAINYYKEVD